MDVNGKNQQNVLTGQVCANHRPQARDAEGEKRWCASCGKDDKGVQHAPANGGWGT